MSCKDLKGKAKLDCIQNKAKKELKILKKLKDGVREARNSKVVDDVKDEVVKAANFVGDKVKALKEKIKEKRKNRKAQKKERRMKKKLGFRG
jgi:hypothetical protein